MFLILDKKTENEYNYKTYIMNLWMMITLFLVNIAKMYRLTTLVTTIQKNSTQTYTFIQLHKMQCDARFFFLLFMIIKMCKLSLLNEREKNIYTAYHIEYTRLKNHSHQFSTKDANKQ